MKNVKLTAIAVMLMGILSCNSQEINCENSSITAAIKDRYRKEQDVREEFMKVLADYQKTGDGAFKLLGMQRKQNKVDKDNQKYVEALIKKCGWANELDKKTHKGIFIIIHHAGYDYMKNYVPMVKVKSELGLLEPDDYPMMLDRVAMNEGKPQLYGTQTFAGSDNKNYVWPIKDIDNLQKRRDSISLPSMEEYFKISKETYNIEMIWDKRLTIEEAKKMRNKK